MTLESHVTSLDLSQRLEALGVPQRSQFWWNSCIGVESKLEQIELTQIKREKEGHSVHGIITYEVIDKKKKKTVRSENCTCKSYSAYLASELVAFMHNELWTIRNDGTTTWYVQAQGKDESILTIQDIGFTETLGKTLEQLLDLKLLETP